MFRPGNPGYWVHPEWETQFPWLIQGTTGQSGDEIGDGLPRNFGLFTEPPAPDASEAWESLCRHLGFPRVVHARQIHGRDVSIHGEVASFQAGDAGVLLPRGESRLRVGPDVDGHITKAEGILLGVTVADCVPVFLVDPKARAVGLLHAGWRGTVDSILEQGIESLRWEMGTDPKTLHLHLGPAICGGCYEVGPEVHAALGLPESPGPSPVDLRGQLAHRAVVLGVETERITQSTWCTLCEGSPFFSHRRGDLERQAGFLGISSRWE